MFHLGLRSRLSLIKRIARSSMALAIRSIESESMPSLWAHSVGHKKRHPCGRRQLVGACWRTWSATFAASPRRGHCLPLPPSPHIPPPPHIAPPSQHRVDLRWQVLLHLYTPQTVLLPFFCCSRLNMHEMTPSLISFTDSLNGHPAGQRDLPALNVGLRLL